jgi:predicted regulator of Ras-like GTPase activity (Roadblock/LC7/MglB family)
MAQGPLVVSEADQDFFHEVLIGLLRKSEASCALLVDQSGRCIARAGFTEKLDVDALAALIAGSFSSTRAMAALVGETEFSVLFHQGQHDHIHNILVDNDRVLAVIFDRRTTVGMVRLCAKNAAKLIADRFSQISKRGISKPTESQIHESMADDAGSRLDQMFE